MAPSNGWEVVYLELDDFHRAAAKALNLDLTTVRSITNETLAGSALAAPAAGFGDFEQYPNSLPRRPSSYRPWPATTHSRMATNGRRCFVVRSSASSTDSRGFPEADDPDGTETAEVIEAV